MFSTLERRKFRSCLTTLAHLYDEDMLYSHCLTGECRKERPPGWPPRGARREEVSFRTWIVESVLELKPSRPFS